MLTETRGMPHLIHTSIIYTTVMPVLLQHAHIPAGLDCRRGAETRESKHSIRDPLISIGQFDVFVFSTFNPKFTRELLSFGNLLWRHYFF